MTEVGKPEREHEITPLVEPIPEVIPMPEPAHAPASPQPVRDPVPVETRRSIRLASSLGG